MNKNVKLDKQKNSFAAEIRALSHDGRGIATIENKTTFIAGALPGESVNCYLHQKRSQFNEGTLTGILTPSSQRTTPPCEHFGVCGGCSLQHMDASMQMQLKQDTLLDQLKHFGQVTPETILAPLSAATLGYRRKARLGVKFVIKKDKLLVGFREKSSSYLADLKRCVVLHPQIGERLEELAALIRSLEAFQHIPQIEVAIGDSNVALVFRHLVPLCADDRAKLISFGEKHQFYIYLQPNPPAVIEKILGDADYLTYTLPNEQLTFLFHPLDFTQVNLEMNRLMVQQAIQLLDLKPTDKVLDLFCGIGNFTLPIARHAQHVTGIEGGAEMVERATMNAQHNLISNVAFYAANLAAPNPDSAWLTQAYDKILLDPPRAGAREMLPFFSKMGAKKIIYVSCNPATLARDAGDLVNLYGYRLTAAGVMNMFPHTAHIEAMAVFEK